MSIISKFDELFFFLSNLHLQYTIYKIDKFILQEKYIILVLSFRQDILYPVNLFCYARLHTQLH